MLHVIKFVIDTKTFGLKREQRKDNNMSWNPKVFVIVIGGRPINKIQYYGINCLLVGVQQFRDTRYHFVRECVEDGLKFVRSNENDSDLFTKNISQKLREKHAQKSLANSSIEYIGWTLLDRKGAGNVPHVHQP